MTRQCSSYNYVPKNIRQLRNLYTHFWFILRSSGLNSKNIATYKVYILQGCIKQQGVRRLLQTLAVMNSAWKVQNTEREKLYNIGTGAAELGKLNWSEVKWPLALPVKWGRKNSLFMVMTGSREWWNSKSATHSVLEFLLPPAAKTVQVIIEFAHQLVL